MRVAILGASGYAGAELLRLILTHPELEVALATADSVVGTAVATHAPSLAAGYSSLVFSPHVAVDSADVELVFCALPHGISQTMVGALRSQGRTVIDLGADFRLRDAAVYEQWYHAQHVAPELLECAVYGLVERYRHELAGATLVAVPGCYPTAAALALGPFADAGWITSTGTIVNALSGTSGAGRALGERLHASRMLGNAEPYGLLTHRHTAEMEQELGVQLLFTPHLVPVSRGMVVTAYAPLVGAHTTSDALALLRSSYEHEPFIVVTNEPPALKDPLGSNLCFVSARVDERTGWLVAMSSIDNLTKGAAGQAVQACNVANGWPETWGLATAGVAP
jgi:N-acetyl-gamma-glutamyl-phosphate reductase